MGNICCNNAHMSSDGSKMFDEPIEASQVAFHHLTQDNIETTETETVITQTSTDPLPLRESDSMSALRSEKEAKRAERAERLARKKSERLAREAKEAERIISDLKAEAAKQVNHD